ncbi:MAG: hypothetical protein U0166_19155 [Acidobacteriota bacterium]
MKAERRSSLFVLLAFHLLFFRHAYLTSDTFFLRDYSVVQTPVKTLALDALRHGVLPLWIPSLSGGQPLLGNPNYFTFHPGNVFPLALGVERGLKAFLLFHYAFASLGALLLGRRLGLPERAALLFALAFAYGGFLCALGNLINALAAAALLPWILLVALRVAAGQARLLHLALAGAVQIFAGEPVPAILSWALGLLVVAHQARRGLPRVAAGFALAIAVAAPQVIPAIVFYEHSDRQGGLGPEAALRWSLPPVRLAELCFPEVLGSTAWSAPPRYLGGPFEDGGYPYLVNVFVGPSPLLLLALAIAASRPGRWVALAALCAAALGLGRHLPLMPLLQSIVPGASIFRYPSKMFLVVSILSTLGAAIGLTYVCDPERARGAAFGAGGLVLSLALGAAIGPAARAIVLRSTGPAGELHDDAVASLVVSAWIVVAILLASSVLLLLHGREIVTPGFAQRGLVGLHAITLLIFMPKVLPMVPRDFYEDVPPPVEAIRREAAAEPSRVYWEQWKPPLMLPRAGDEDPALAAHNARAVRRLGQEFVGRLFGLEYAFETGWEGVALGRSGARRTRSSGFPGPRRGPDWTPPTSATSSPSSSTPTSRSWRR